MTEHAQGPSRGVDAVRHARHLRLEEIGQQGQAVLGASSVAVVGAGGLGSPVLLYLAAAGVGRITVIDDDVVNLSNLQRQVIYRTQDVGRPKAEVARERLLDLDPNVDVVVHVERLNPDNALSLLEGHDLVVDGTDLIPARYLIDDACALLGLPWIHASVHRFEGRLAYFEPEAGPSYRDLHPEPPPPGSVQACDEVGVLGAVPGVLGTMQAALSVEVLLGRNEPARGRLTLVDVQSMDTRHLRFHRLEGRMSPTDLSNARALWQADPACNLGRHLEGTDAATRGQMFHQIDSAAFLQRRADGWNPFVLDVRSSQEHASMAAHSCNITVPHAQVLDVMADLPESGDILIHCKSGMRSMMAAMALMEAGIDGSRLYNLEDGILGWYAQAPEDIRVG
ncbi:MAG: molybdenum cofactor biosynthesis protein MoeB [Euryarchaeota archaeon]|nr:molybdenum cofactor biosynthesis protein MoeB [Euryarchaeota archaeon]